jgi:hypothetical protein
MLLLIWRCMLCPADSGRLSGYDTTSMARSTAGHRPILLTFPENCRRSLGCGLSNIAQQSTETRINSCRPADVTRSWKGSPVIAP